MDSLLDPRVRLIDWPRLERFLELRLPESLNLDYKRDWSPSVLEGVAAMANTYGGAVLIGVDEDEARPARPQLPVLGVAPDVRERLVNQCYAKLEPPVSVDVLPVAIPGGEREVLIVRIDPARVERPVVLDGKVFVRLEGRNAPATRAQIQALFQSGLPVPVPVPYGVSPLGIMDPRGQGGHFPLDDPATPSLVIRSGLAAPVPPWKLWDAIIDSRARTELAQLLEHSPFVRWLSQTNFEWLDSFSSSTWIEGGAHTRGTSSIATLRWRAFAPNGRQLPLAGQCVLALPGGTTGGPWLRLYLDAALAAIPKPDGKGHQAPRLSLPSVFGCLRASLDTVLDVLAPAVFPLVLDVPAWQTIGPVCHLGAGPWEPTAGEPRWTLGHFVEVDRYRSEPGSDWPTQATFPPPPDTDPSEPDQRNRLILVGLTRLLLDVGIRAFEHDLAALAAAEPER